MQIHKLDKAAIINELQFGSGISHAIQEGRRSDFALILSMFSSDIRDVVPLEEVETIESDDQLLRSQLGVPQPQTLRSESSSYDIAAEQSKQFHQAGLSSAKLSHYLKPDALTYQPEDTFDLPEEVYHNLSGHERRSLSQPKKNPLPYTGLHEKLITAQRKQQIQMQA
ncbi:hypothetical protein BS333_09065 [Vibrio azureus]|uniref:Uncharacterized protein n=1 Tax=Vibrio azureus NBRC 104587 TaxID=1219077 RepID=U3BXU5_9VIBR|nr:VC2046/SO_2500 family protein [Vibrio azureus]AUI86521.1 hypothetical protein BS333_09065 [Vibrio azureus]GAD74139.1 hypothetical protein VAZ01S_004_00140 [Vibrio azureus NBRC 104587]